MKSLLPAWMLLMTLTPLVVHPVEGIVLTKCGLKSQLDAAFLAAQPTTSPQSNATANTTVPPPANHTFESLVAKIVCKAQETTGFNTNTLAVLERGDKSHVIKSEKKKEKQENKKNENHQTLYGIFQLSDHLACSNGVIASEDLCKTSCTSFLDDNIGNDITCLLTILQSIEKDDIEFPKGCAPSNYFSGCA